MPKSVKENIVLADDESGDKGAFIGEKEKVCDVDRCVCAHWYPNNLTKGLVAELQV